MTSGMREELCQQRLKARVSALLGLLEKGERGMSDLVPCSMAKAAQLQASDHSSCCYSISYLCTYDFTAPYLMFLMRADPLRGQVGGGWALE
jgi:hypothetical protein